MEINRLSIQTSIVAIIRGDLTVGCVADRYGVTESEVLEWHDTFFVGGILALRDLLHGELGCGGSMGGTRLDELKAGGGLGDPTTTQIHNP